MREVKFRVWDKDNKKMFPVATVSKHYGIEADCSIDDIGSVHIANPELMQYTGLHDSTPWSDLSDKEKVDWIASGKKESDWNGKEICEGDILAYGSRVCGQVIWQPPSFVIKRSPKHKSWVEFALAYTERQFETVVGNIYENKELLKEVEL